MCCSENILYLIILGKASGNMVRVPLSTLSCLKFRCPSSYDDVFSDHFCCEACESRIGSSNCPSILEYIRLLYIMLAYFRSF